jgi:hypothetical protein
VDKVNENLLDAAAVDAHGRKVWGNLDPEYETGALYLRSESLDRPRQQSGRIAGLRIENGPSRL